MQSARSVGRVVGVLLLVQGVAGYVMNFVLLRPVFSTPPGFLANAAGSASEVRVAALIGIATGALSVAIAITAFPIFRRYGERMALWHLSLSVVGFALIAVENGMVLTMLALSQDYAMTGSSDAGVFRALATVVRSARNTAHYTNLLVSGGTILVLYALLFRSALVPRVLAAFGIAAVLLQMGAVSMPLLGERMALQLLTPLGVTHLALSLWLLARGFVERRRPHPAAPHGVELSRA